MGFFGLLIIAALLAVSFKITGFFLRLLGKVIGVVFSIAGYALIGFLAVGVFSIGLLILPVILVVGIIAIISALT